MKTLSHALNVDRLRKSSPKLKKGVEIRAKLGRGTSTTAVNKSSMVGAVPGRKRGGRTGEGKRVVKDHPEDSGHGHVAVI